MSFTGILVAFRIGITIRCRADTYVGIRIRNCRTENNIRWNCQLGEPRVGDFGIIIGIRCNSKANLGRSGIRNYGTDEGHISGERTKVDWENVNIGDCEEDRKWN